MRRDLAVRAAHGAFAEGERRGAQQPPSLGDEAALPRLRALLDETEMWRQLGDLAGHAELTWLRHVSGTDLGLREMLARKLGALKAELGGPAPTPLERLMIDRIAINWLIVGHADLEAAGTKDGDPRRADLALRRQTQAEQRFAERGDPNDDIASDDED